MAIARKALPRRARRVVVLCAVTAAVAVAAPPAGAAVPTPVPPKNYSNLTQCVSAANAGDTLKNGVSWAQSQLDYTSVWKLGNRGAGQKIAVIDTGVNDVSAFGGRLSGGGDYVVRNGTGLSDCDGHGTVVAGLIAASPDSASGFAGVAPGAELLSIRQSSSYYGVKDAKEGSPDRTAGTTTSLAQAIELAVAKGATVINISEASCRPPTVGADAELRAAVDDAVTKGVVIVAAAGNVDSSTRCRTQNTPGRPPRTIPTPAEFPGVLSVAAVDSAGQPAPFSLSGSWVGVAAPGVGIVSTNPVKGSTGQINEFITDSGVSPIQGTSFAAPYVTGLVALVRERFPALDPAGVIARIERTADHPAAPGGRNDDVGSGVIDPAAALTAVLPGEGGSTPSPRSGPSVLPAAHAHTDPEHDARLVSLIGTLALLVVATAAAIALSTRRGRAGALARRSALRAAGGGRGRG